MNYYDLGSSKLLELDPVLKEACNNALSKKLREHEDKSEFWIQGYAEDFTNEFVKGYYGEQRRIITNLYIAGYEVAAISRMIGLSVDRIWDAIEYEIYILYNKISELGYGGDPYDKDSLMHKYLKLKELHELDKNIKELIPLLKKRTSIKDNLIKECYVRGSKPEFFIQILQMTEAEVDELFSKSREQMDV